MNAFDSQTRESQRITAMADGFTASARRALAEALRPVESTIASIPASYATSMTAAIPDLSAAVKAAASPRVDTSPLFATSQAVKKAMLPTHPAIASMLASSPALDFPAAFANAYMRTVPKMDSSWFASASLRQMPHVDWARLAVMPILPRVTVREPLMPRLLLEEMGLPFGRSLIAGMPDMSRIIRESGIFETSRAIERAFELLRPVIDASMFTNWSRDWLSEPAPASATDYWPLQEQALAEFRRGLRDDPLIDPEVMRAVELIVAAVFSGYSFVHREYAAGIGEISFGLFVYLVALIASRNRTSRV